MKTSVSTKGEALHFRVETVALLKEIIESNDRMGIFKIPVNTLMNLIAQVAQRATELQDPILDKLMFDLHLYELPRPTSKEYSELMTRVYHRAKEFKKATT